MRVSLALLLLLLVSKNAAADEGFMGDLNLALQQAAFATLRHHGSKTGTVHNFTLPPPLGGAVLAAAAVRLRAGSLHRRGFVMNEFTIPRGAHTVSRSSAHFAASLLSPRQPQRLVLVYRSLRPATAAWEGRRLVAPVVGIKVYDATATLSPVLLPPPQELRLVMGGSEGAKVSLPAAAGVECAATVVVSRGAGTCTARELGDFALAAPLGRGGGGGGVAAGAAAAAAALTAMLGAAAAAVVVGLRRRRAREMLRMEHQSERGEALDVLSIGGLSRAPVVASPARTRPLLVDDYIG